MQRNIKNHLKCGCSNETQGWKDAKSRRLYYLVNILRLAQQNVQAAWPLTGPQAQNYGLRCSTSQQLDGF